MKSIQMKLTVTILVIFLVAMSALGSFNYWKARVIITGEITSSMEKLVDSYALSIGDWLDKGIYHLEGIAKAPVLQNGNLEEMGPFFVQVKKNMTKFATVGYAAPDGQAIDAKGFKLNFGTKTWFQAAMKGEPSVSDPVISPSGDLEIILAVPVKVEGKTIGVLFGAINIADINQKVLDIKAGDNGYGFMVQKNGLTIVHPNKKIAMKDNILERDVDSSMKKTFEHMVAGEAGLAEYSYKGVKNTVAFAPVPRTGWSLAVNVPTAEITREVASLTTISLKTIIVVLVLTGLIITWYARKIAKPIQKLEMAAKRIADGDISNTTLDINSNDEIGRLGQSFEQMAGNLRSLIQKIHGATEQVAASSQELTASSEQSAQAANQIAVSITNVAAGTSEQVVAAKDTTTVVEQMSAAIEQIAANANQVADYSAQAAQKAQDGDKAVEKAVEQMGNIEETVNASAQVVAKLGERSKEIGQIVDTISGIAGQTNLLALNAAIEAARAGEQGRGFAVVAEEVRKLAEQSQEAAKKIAKLIGVIQVDTHRAVEAMDNGNKEVKIGAEVVNTAGMAFQKIVSLVTGMSRQVKEISTAMQQMAAESQHIVVSVKKIDDLGQKSSTETQSISAAAEEQLASMEKIASSSQALAKLADDLQVLVFSFRL
ncbi:methyl-accepting chemotaxis protein [Sporomusa acidovorans]|uniref:Methyl-accepting chemotaxis protein McpB n=1 Tax=Sporomusa acidovorans (strain ATCC 49682 / DSM 3132 / Mol) TaxID=1123286 RepID=A0ABZ3J2N9_SPOA4|nr:methyl-accepting chemotaxis protein [Sporomusa acidovorans]OZC23237.1 methyl-accepting chemotaxis protein McpB [Sporomusa acidovorans DSM 3132]SDE98380.1 methyl-accepting chemotaxis protein [Sporomusa acidovorans]